MVRVGITEIDIAFEDKSFAMDSCMKVMEEAHKNGVELLVFPEMTLSGFTMMPAKMGEAYRDGKIPESISFFMENSRKYNMAMAFGYIEALMEDGSSVYDDSKRHVYENRLAVVDGDNIVMEYSKIHPFSYSGEDRVYRAGDKLCQADVRGLRIGGYICYDLRFPEIFTAARDKYDAAVVIANWPESRVKQWEILLRARAVENQAYVIGVNRIGNGKGISYTASSHVFDFSGNDISRRVSGDLLIADLDPGLVRRARIGFPQGRDRKADLYRELLV